MTYKNHPVFIEPDDMHIRIWRYMDFTKFVSMLENKGLFFARSDTLKDQFEGSYAIYNREMRPTVYKDIFSKDAFDQHSRFCQWIRKWTMALCWHMNDHESSAMWKLYSKSNEAIAIQSTYTILKESLYDNEDIFIGLVSYIDYDKEWLPEGNHFYPFVHKRKSFEHERELRGLIQKIPTKDGCIDHSITPPIMGYG